MNQERKSQQKEIEKNSDLSPRLTSDRLRSTHDSQKKDQAKRLIKHSESLVQIKPPSKRLSAFELLVNSSEQAETLYPISFFQQKIERQRSTNTFIKAFEKGKSFDLFSISYVQPDHFNKHILGHRLKDTIVRIKSKLLKIKQAMRLSQQKEIQTEHNH